MVGSCFSPKNCAQEDQGSDYPPVLSTGEATSQNLCSVLGPSLQDRPWGAGVCLEKRHEDVEGSRE